MDLRTRILVRERAGDRCEYCRLRQDQAALWHHQLEHIIPRKHGGNDEPDNLAWACVRCNLGKGSNLSGRDAETGQIVPLFDPRRQSWWEHFAFEEAEIVGLTPTGRVTVAVLNMNEPSCSVRRRCSVNGPVEILFLRHDEWFPQPLIFDIQRAQLDVLGKSSRSPNRLHPFTLFFIRGSVLPSVGLADSH